MINHLSNKLGFDFKYFAGGGLWLTLYTIIGAIGGLALSFAFARLWPSDVFGQFSLVNSLLAFLALTALPGMAQAVTQASAENNDGVLKKAVGVVFKWSLLGSIVLIFCSTYFFFRGNISLAIAVFFGAISFPINVTFSMFGSFLTGKKLFKQFALFSLIAQYVSIFSTLIALLFLPSLIWVTFFSLFSSAAINLFLSFIVFKEAKNDKFKKSFIDLGKNLSIAQLFTIFADYADKFFIPFILGFSQNAAWAFALIIPTQLHNFLKTLTILSHPKIAGLTDKQIRSDLNKKIAQLFLIVTFIVIIYILLAPYIFHFMYPAYEKSSVFPSQIFALSLIYYPSNLYSLTLVKKRDTSSLNKINIIYFIVTVVTVGLFVPLFGILGAAISKVMARIVYSFCQLFYSKKTYSK